MKRSLLFILVLSLACSAVAQQKTVNKKTTPQTRKEVRTGNKAYNKKNYTDAEAAYRKALASDSTYYKSQYNLGNSLYRQKNYSQAAQHFTRALQDPTLSGRKRSQVYHNLGNSYMQEGLSQRDGQGGGREQFQQAVTNYQEALKLDPKNQDTKYNLSLAKKLLATAQQQQNQKQQQNGGGNNNKDKQDKKDQNQGNQGDQKDKVNQKKQGDQGDNKNQNDKKDQNKGDNGNQKQDPKQDKGQQPKQSQKEKDAERLLNAVRNNEKNTQKQVRRGQESKVDGRIEKDW